MSAVPSASSPPPSPSPSRRISPFDDLPAELLLYIHSYLGLQSYTHLALAIYPTLRRHGLVPPLTIPTFVRLTRNSQRTPTSSSNTSSPRALAQLPTELWLQIADQGDSTDNISMVFALYGQFWRVLEPMDDETWTRLRVWSRRSGK
jgi:hypothetical protein